MYFQFRQQLLQRPNEVTSTLPDVSHSHITPLTYSSPDDGSFPHPSDTYRYSCPQAKLNLNIDTYLMNQQMYNGTTCFNMY